MTRWRFFLALVVAFSLAGAAEESHKLIVSRDVTFDVAHERSLAKSINKYLDGFIGHDATSENRRLAEDFIRSLYPVSKVQCNFFVVNDGESLNCAIELKRTIKRIKVENLPASLLEGELKRRLPVEIGQTVDIKDGINEFLGVIKTRTEVFLRKNGYYDAKVKVTLDAQPGLGSADIVINIENGAFVLVNSVLVTGDQPVSAVSIRRQFKRMCFSFNRIIESISMGTLSCYSRELERETVQSVQDRLAKMGFVQSQIRVSHYWVNPNDKSLPRYCQADGDKAPKYRCINLKVHIDKGPRFRWTVNVKDQLSISRNALQRFIGTIFSVDQISRASTSNYSDEIALDHLIVDEDLLNRVTFISAKNVDEQELSSSVQEITDFLVAHGYANAEVVPSLTQEDEENVVVNFDVFAEKPYFVETVRIIPERYAAFFDEDSLNNLLHARSLADNGALSYASVEAAKEEIVNQLKARGFSNISLTSDLEALSNGGVQVLFNVKADEREVLDEVVIMNGYTDVTEEVLPLLGNCDKYVRPKRSKHIRKICSGSSFVRDRIEEDSNKIAEHYINNGFLYAKVTSEISQSKDGTRLIFSLFDSRHGASQLTPLVQQNIKDIIVSGNTTTSSSAIKRLFPRESRWPKRNPISLKKGLANLRESGRFSRFDNKILFSQENSDEAYFLVQVAERPTLSLDTSIAFSTDQLFSFEAELEETNLFWSMLKLNTSLGLGFLWGRQSFLSNKFIWPRILGNPLGLTINAPYIVYDDWLHLAKPRRRVQSKISFRLDWRLTPNVMPYLEYWVIFTQEKLFQPDQLPDTSFGPSLRTLDGLIPTLKAPGRIQGVLKPGILYMRLDNPFDPHSGVDTNWWTEFSGGPLLGHPPFVNLGVQNRFFIPLGPLTLALQATFMRAFIEPSEDNWNKLRDVSAMDALGGDRTVRGYHDQEIAAPAFDGVKDEFAGYLSNIANVELRFPLTTKGAIGNFSGALFVDQGMVLPCGTLTRCLGNSLDSLVAKKGFGLSIGAALRYSLPVGPISLDYGVSPITGRGRVHVLFGYAF